MRSLGGLILAIVASLAAPVAAQDRYGPAAAAELESICEADRARLWGADLCGPLLVVDPATRIAWASQPDWNRILRPNGTGWSGRLPDGVTVANTSVEWSGVRWIMLLSPLPEDAAERRVLVAHEAWHRAQDALGFPQLASDNAHLETERGRYLIRLEFRALATALRSRGRARREAAQHALFLRNVRLSEFLSATAQENALDRNEGLAAYTGVRLGAGDDAEMYAARLLDGQDDNEAFARSYAYASGPAYGLLLDEVRSGWQRNLGAHTPAALLSASLRTPPYDPAVLQEIETRYGGIAVMAEERAHTQERGLRDASFRQRFSAGPRLVLPVSQMQMEFDPNAVTPIEGLGSVYRTLTVRDAWGELRATDGALISPDFTRIVVAAPGPDGRSGPGWSLNLAPGATVALPDATGVRTVLRP
jgi:hypothetical protein